MGTELTTNRSIVEANANFLDKELDWLRQWIDLRFRLYFNDNPSHKSPFDLPLPVIEETACTYGEFIRNNRLGTAERLVLILSLAPFLRSELLDAFYAKNTTY